MRRLFAERYVTVGRWEGTWDSTASRAGSRQGWRSDGRRLIVVLPAYNAESTLQRTLQDLPPGMADDLVLVDDASRDGTAALARRLGLRTIVHERNLGYGANQKRCYREALALGAEIVVMPIPTTSTARDSCLRSPGWWRAASTTSPSARGSWAGARGRAGCRSTSTSPIAR